MANKARLELTLKPRNPHKIRSTTQISGWLITENDEAPKNVPLTKKERITNIYMPIAIVLLTASLGTGIGVWLQNRSFRRNEVFKAKLDRIKEGQKETAEILREVDEARRQIRANEDFIRREIEQQSDPIEKDKVRRYYLEKNPMGSSLVILKESKIRLDALGDYTKTLSPANTVPSSIENYSIKLGNFLECLEDNKDFGKSCSDEHPTLREALRAVVTAYTKIEDELIDAYD
jgi:hypothetical protein